MYTIENAKKSIKNGIRSYLLKDENGKYVMNEVNRLPFYLEGEPGIGKTEIVKQIAEELDIGYVSFSLVHHTRNSLLGLPVIDELEAGEKYSRYTLSEIIAKVMMEMDYEGHKEGILLLDEFPCMSESIVPAMLAFLQTKNIGTHTLPEGWVLVLCGNPPKYNKASRRFDASILDRVRKIEISYEAQSFLEYATKIGVHKCIIDFISMDNSKGYRFEKIDETIELVTCRSWENLSHMIKTYEMLGQEICMEDVAQYIKSDTIAKEFYLYYIQYISGMSYEDCGCIVKGEDKEKYLEMVKSKGFDFQYKIIDSLLSAFESINEEYFDWVKNKKLVLGTKEVRKSNMIRAAEAKASEQMNNLLSFMRMIDNDKALKSILFTVINSNPVMLQLMSDCPCEEYLKECESRYGEFI